MNAMTPYPTSEARRARQIAIWAPLAFAAVLLIAGLSRAAPPEDAQTLSGRLHIVWGDARDGRTKIEFSLALPDGREVVLAPAEAGDENGGIPLFWRDQIVQVRGRWLDESADSPRLAVAAIARPQQGGAQAAIPKVMGSQPWVSIPCKFADIADEPRPPGYFQDIYGSDYPALDHYWRELSYNQINLAGSSAASRWFTLPRSRSYYVYDRDGDGQPDLDLRRAAFDCTAVADPSVDFFPFTGIHLMFNGELGGFAYGGSSPTLRLDGRWDNWDMTWEPVWGYNNLSVLAHEMGHGFGLPHSSGMYGRTYDNVWDVMSDSECRGWKPPYPHPVFGCLGQHTIAYYKDLLGWIGARRAVVALGEERTLTLEQLALPQTGDLLLAIVPIAGSNERFYTVEARRQVGYDVILPGQAIIIHQVDVNRDESPAHVIDSDTDNTYTGDDGAQWLPGETFFDPANNIRIRVDAATETGFVVTIRNSDPVTSSPTPTATPTGTPAPTDTPTPTHTPTRMARPTMTPGDPATPTATFEPPTTWLPLPLVLVAHKRGSPPPISALRNGDFEAGPGPAWDQISSQGLHLIVRGALPAAPHAGDWAAWLGGADYEASTLSQTVILPLSPPLSLRFWSYLISDDSCGYDSAALSIEGIGDPLWSSELCTENETGAWEQNELSLAAFAGQTITLTFRTTADDSLISSLLIDDVSLAP